MEYRTREEMHKAHLERRRRMAEAAERYRLSKLTPPKPKFIELPQSPLLPEVKVVTQPKPLTNDEVNKILSKYKLVASIGIATRPYKSNTLREFTQDVCRRHGISEAEIFSRRRHKKIVHARWELWYLIRKNLNLSYPQIGVRCGGVDHTTVIYGVAEYEKILAQREKDMVKPEIHIDENELIGLS